MRIRILHVLDSWGNAGIQNGIANLVSRMDPLRFEHIICGVRSVPQSNLQPLPLGRATLMCLADHETRPRFQFPALVRLIQRLRPALVHSRNWGAVEAVFAARCAGVQGIIHSEHGIDTDTLSAEPFRRRCLRRLAFEAAHRVMSVSFGTRNLHTRRTGFPARRIQVIHNGVDTVRFHPDAAARARIRRELGIEDSDFCIGCVGNLLRVKDHLTVLRSLALLSQATGGWRVLLAGDGPELPRLKEFAASHGLTEKVIILGRSQQVPAILNALDAYVLSSLTEGICNSLLEAMATSLPVVVTHTGGNPEVVVEGESGMFFPVGDADVLTQQLSLLRQDRNHRHRLASGARDRVLTDFSLEAMVQSYERLYEGLLPAFQMNVQAAEA